MDCVVLAVAGSSRRHTLCSCDRAPFRRTAAKSRSAFSVASERQADRGQGNDMRNRLTFTWRDLHCEQPFRDLREPRRGMRKEERAKGEREREKESEAK